MAKLVQPPPKFLHPEWNLSNQMKYANAEGERTAAERLIDESDRVCDDTTTITNNSQKDVTNKLEARIDDIKYWESEVDRKLKEIKAEIDNLDAYKMRVQKELEATREPLHIAQQCLINRQQRVKVDLVHDDPEKHLMKEVETIQGVQALLQRTIEQAVEQNRLNRKARYNLEKDLKDKFSARTIDEGNSAMRNNSADICFKDAAAKIDVNSTTPDEWEDFSNVNVLDSEKQRMNSASLRSLMDGILQQSANDMHRQRESTDLAFTKRIAETSDTKQKLQEHLSKVLKQIQDMEDNIDRLVAAIKAKEAPMKVCDTRLDNRSRRDNVELCRDDVQYRLIQENADLRTSVLNLQHKLAQSEDSLKGLIRRKLDLEDDIQVKTKTLFIDETQCMGMRKSISIHAF